MEFKDRLRELRQIRGLSQKELGTKTGFSMSIINKWENGKKSPGMSALIILAQFFNESLDYIVGLTN